jgi:hypothetical protein
MRNLGKTRSGNKRPSPNRAWLDTSGERRIGAGKRYERTKRKTSE